MKSYNELTDNDKNNIIEKYYSDINLTLDDISKLLNVSGRSVPRVLSEAGINTKLKNRYIIKNENYFENIDDEFKAYILGFIYADGFVGLHDDFCISLTDKCDDNYKILSMLKEKLGTNLKIKHGKNKDGSGYYTFKFSNKKIVHDLNSLGVYTKKSLNMTDIPNIDNKYMNHFIRGYFDGDGSIFTYYDKYDNRIRTSIEILGTEQFLDKLLNIIVKECCIKKTKFHNVNHVNGLTRIAYKGIKNIIKIRDYFYKDATIYLTYKYNRFYSI